MRPLALCVFAAAMTATTMMAAEEYHRQMISGGFIANIPTGSVSLSSGLATTRPGASFGYGVNLTSHVMAEVGIDWISHPLGSVSAFGYGINSGDQLYLVPFGARYGFGPSDGKWRVYAGGGGAFAKHTFPTGASFLLNQTGFGGYFLTGADVALGEHVRLGGVMRYYHMGQNSNLVQLGLTPSSFITAGPQISFTF